MQDISRSVIAIGITCTLFGCGGGGGSNLTSQSPTELMTITRENGGQVAKAGMETGDNIIAGNSVSSLFTAKVREDEDSEKGQKRSSVRIWIEYIIAKYITIHSVLLEASRITTESQSCFSGGTVSREFSDNNANGILDAGDSWRLTLQNCGESDVIFNGELRLNINRLQANESEFNMQANNLTITTENDSIGLDGGFNLSSVFDELSGIDTNTFQGSELNYQNDNMKARLISFRFVEKLGGTVPEQYTLEYDFSFDEAGLGGRVIVVTEVPLSGQGDFAPDSGEATITGANGSAIIIEAESGQARIFLDDNANGDFDGSDELIYEGLWNNFFDD